MIRNVMRNPLRNVMRNPFAGLGGIDLTGIAFVVGFKTGVIPKDLISNNSMTTILEAGRGDINGLGILEDIPSILNNQLRSSPDYDALLLYSEDTSNWTGSGPWTRTENVVATNPYVVSTFLNGVTITVTAGTATIDAPASATFGNPDFFIVTGSGTIIVTTDIADPKGLLTQSTYPLDYIKTEASQVAVPLDNSYTDVIEKGNFFEGILANFSNLLNTLDGVADGVNLFTDNNDFSIWTVPGTPDGYTLLLNDANNYLAEVSTGCRMVGDNANAGFRTTIDGITVVAETQYSWIISISDYISGSVRYRVFDDSNNVDIPGTSFAELGVVGNGLCQVRFATPVGCTKLRLYMYKSLTEAADVDLVFNVWEVKQISKAKGELHIPKLSFGFNAADISSDVNIIDLNQDGLFLKWLQATNQLQLSDGTNQVVVSHTPVRDAEIDIKAVWDGSLSSMAIAVNDAPGTAGTFAGNFEIGATDNMAIGREAELFRLGNDDSGRSIIFHEEPQNTGWL